MWFYAYDTNSIKTRDAFLLLFLFLFYAKGLNKKFRYKWGLAILTPSCQSTIKAYIAQNAIVFGDMYLQCLVYQHAAETFAHRKLVDYDWSTSLALGIF